MLPNATSILAALSVCTYLTSTSSVRGQCLKERLFDGEAVAGDAFGYALAISGDTAVVGAVTADTEAGVDAGAAYVYVRIGNDWVHQADLIPADLAAGDQFGYSVAIDGDTIVVGADWVDLPGKSNCGAAFVFVRNGTTWTQQQKLIAFDGAASDFFGVSAGISGDTVVIGAPGDNTSGGTNAGSAYVYVRQGTSWIEQDRLFASDAAANDFFSGYAVSIDGDTIVVGAINDNTAAGTDAGSAYVYVRSGTSWSQEAHLIPSPHAAFDYFGASVALSGDTIIASASSDTIAGVDAGSAFVFRRTGTTWTQEALLFSPVPFAGELFGWWVGLSGDRAIVGAPADPNIGVGSESGTAYVFERAEGIWTATAHLVPHDGAAGDDFGACVAISGTTVIVGADYDDTIAAPNAGSVYVFDLGCKLGDLDCNNAVDLADLPHCIDALLNPGTFSGCDITRADLNSDGLIDGRDLKGFVHALTGN